MNTYVFSSGATGGVMRLTNMAHPALPVQPAMPEAAGTIFATKVSLRPFRVPLPHIVYTVGLPCVICYLHMLWQNLHLTSFSEGGVAQRPAPETEETNYIEAEPEAVPQPRAQSPEPSPTENLERNQVVSTEQMCKEYSK